MRSLLFAALALASVAAVPRGAEPRGDEGVSDLVFFGVLEGLYRDGVSNEAVDIVLAREPLANGEERYVHFVAGCPLCVPALNAFRVYRQRPPFEGWKMLTDTFGPGLAEAELERLRGDEVRPRLDVLHALIERWVGRRLELQRLSEKETERWQQRLQEARKKGMACLASNRRAGTAGSLAAEEGCAICDGANAACGNR